MADHKTYIDAQTSLPELTVKAVILGCVISAIVAASNAYLGLFAGMTVSASIPAAVISMALLKAFKRNNILENNIVQTGGSAGASLTAGVIFTIPALLLMGYWQEFNYWETTAIALVGGLLGVFYTIPLRRALIVKKQLRYPEGVATAEVLKAGEEGGGAMKYLALSSLLGAVYKYAASGAKLWGGIFEHASLVGGKLFTFVGLNLSPALMGVGYIVGLRISLIIFLGGTFSWYVAIPYYIFNHPVPEGMDLVKYGYSVWNSQIRFLGVGAMLTGGLWAVYDMRDSLFGAFHEGWDAFKKSTEDHEAKPRTDQDISMSKVLLGIGILIIPIFYLYYRNIQQVSTTLVMTLVMVVAGFLFASVAGYMAGLVGSSNNPTSGITIATILFASLVLLLLLGAAHPKGAAAAILIGGVVCCGCTIAGDNTQDLKSGYLLGATPWKQQIAQILGVISAAFVIAPTLNLLNMAYGFGAKTAEHPNALPAPQATLMHSVTTGVFGGGLPWDMIALGAVIGAFVIILDQYLKNKGSAWRVPVLSIAIGIYLPLELDSTIFLGGLMAYFVESYRKKKQSQVKDEESAKTRSDRTGLLIASGLVTGEALVGILIALPIAITSNPKILQLVDSNLGAWPGMVILAGICFWLVRSSQKAFVEE